MSKNYGDMNNKFDDDEFWGNLIGTIIFGIIVLLYCLL